jgi:hypothetical protein
MFLFLDDFKSREILAGEGAKGTALARDLSLVAKHIFGFAVSIFGFVTFYHANLRFVCLRGKTRVPHRRFRAKENAPRPMGRGAR